jgi:hypothetical protein
MTERQEAGKMTKFVVFLRGINVGLQIALFLCSLLQNREERRNAMSFQDLGLAVDIKMQA